MALSIIALSAGLSVFLLAIFLVFAYRSVPDEDRSYRDPLPGSLQMIWPLLQVMAFYLCAHFPLFILEGIEQRLVRTGVSFMLTAEQFLSLCLVSGIAFPLGAHVCMMALDNYVPSIVLVAMVLGLLFPFIWLNDTRKRRELAVIRTMPVYLDFVTMCVEAGLNLTGALGQAMEKAPPGPLRNEFAIVLRDLRSGVTRADALRRMGERLDISEVTSFVSAVVQAERMGASLASVLRVQAEQRREERFQRAEKMAMEAPIKLVGPLVIFIFPVTFIILGFPIVMKFLNQGIL